MSPLLVVLKHLIPALSRIYRDLKRAETTEDPDALGKYVADAVEVYLARRSSRINWFD